MHYVSNRVTTFHLLFSYVSHNRTMQSRLATLKERIMIFTLIIDEHRIYKLNSTNMSLQPVIFY
jgi:hypothetical protein